MQVKNVLYAAVGAPVVAARKVNDVVGDWKARIDEEASDYTEIAGKALENWADEGQKVVARVSDNKTVEEITAKVDLDQVQEQVGKLRSQLEDMLATWRTSFRPERASGRAAEEAAVTATAPATKKPAAKKTQAKKAPAKKTAAKKTAAKPASGTAAKRATASKAKSTAAKSSQAKSTAAKPSQAKSTSSKTAKAS